MSFYYRFLYSDGDLFTNDPIELQDWFNDTSGYITVISVCTDAKNGEFFTELIDCYKDMEITECDTDQEIIPLVFSELPPGNVPPNKRFCIHGGNNHDLDCYCDINSR